MLQLIMSGVSDKEIALRLGMDTSTVRSHVARLCEKLGAANRCQLAAFAEREGLTGTPALDAPVAAF